MVFVHACRPTPRGDHSAVLLPYPRAEFERWERAEQRFRRRRRRELWVTACGMEVA
ncbi:MULTISPECIES: hypothetical protein [unclassified Streptomyces]|uniref:hypothetical protein n=1 Tax=Streptomyces sp. NPDC056907 TaxID=3345962 RepID=UPI0036A0E5A3